MTNKLKAFVTGIGGQDGSYLAEHLLEKDYDVYGIIRRHSVSESQDSRIQHLQDKINIDYGDILDGSSIHKLLDKIKPDEVYNLAAQSHVRISFDIPEFTIRNNIMGLVNVLEAFRQTTPHGKFYQASSSEIFGNNVDVDGFQRLSTPMNPVSPYGCSKLFGYSIVKNYRNSYKLFASNGVLFNHEGPRRGSNFVTSKVVKTACEIKLGLRDNLVLGNMDTYRDWGHAKDYTRAMMMILSHDVPDDFIVATGIAHSITDLCDYTFKRLELDYRDYVTQDEKFMRAEELKYLRGDCLRTKEILGWEPEYTFESMVNETVDYWLNRLRIEEIMRKNKDGKLQNL